MSICEVFKNGIQSKTMMEYSLFCGEGSSSAGERASFSLGAARVASMSPPPRPLHTGLAFVGPCLFFGPSGSLPASGRLLTWGAEPPIQWAGPAASRLGVALATIEPGLSTQNRFLTPVSARAGLTEVGGRKLRMRTFVVP